MKIALFTLMLTLSISAFAQDEKPLYDSLPIDSSSQMIVFQEVVKVDSISKDDLFTRARSWFATAFRSANSVLQMDDRTSGKLIGKGNATGSYKFMLVPYNFTLSFTVAITVKDGRYWYELSEFTSTEEPNQYVAHPQPQPIEKIALDPTNRKENGEYKGRWKGYIKSTLETANFLCKSLKEAMAGNAKAIKSKDDF